MPSLLQPRLSGHETFACRFAWLPKVVKELNAPSDAAKFLFKDENEAMVRLGVGKNMVRSIKFWGETAGIIAPAADGGHEVTHFGNQLLGHESHDPYLEHQKTLWLLHWKIATSSPPIFYWNQMLNHWHRPEFSFSEILPFLERSLPLNAKSSNRTISDGYKVFVHTYTRTRGNKGEVSEDSLDCPLVELGLIHATGDRRIHDNGPKEDIYCFNYDDKPDVNDALFAYCLNDYWQKSSHSGETLAFRYISAGENSPGQIFKLPELAVRARLERLAETTDGALEFIESSTIQQVVRNKEISETRALGRIYFNNL